ncbi:MAG: hypothetical protein C0469_09475 [Cyanobacteria bacterium DS2.3.42]|nr:hypothetical protein [Cyanobacteria bacterium DS2.3.42]
MKAETESVIEAILQRVAYCAIPVSWRTDNPFPGVGNRKGVRRGPGLDFLGTALFQEGDDERHINWVATAQAGDDDEVYKTIYRQRKEIKAHIFVDVSLSMDYGSERSTKRGVAAEVAASVLYALDKTRDKVGCTVFSRDTVHEVVPTRPARLNLIPSLVEILETDAIAQSQLDSKPGDGLSKAVSILPNSRQLVFVVSDFMNMSKADWESLGNLATVHDVICIFVQDRRERELPDSKSLGRLGFIYRIQDASGESKWVYNNERTRRQWRANWKAHEASISAAIAEFNCELLILSTEENESAIVSVLNLFAGHG